MKRTHLIAALELVAEPCRLGGAALARGAVAAALFLWLTAPVYWVLSVRRRRKPRKANDSAFVYTMR